MSFNVDDFGGYGSGSLGNVTDPPYAVINAYAAVVEIRTYSILVTPISNSQYLSWDDCVGCQVLVHAVTAKNSATGSLGKFAVATITAQALEDDGLRLTLDTDYTIIPQMTKEYAYWQAILIAEFNNLTLQSKNVAPEPFTLNNTPIGGYNSVFAPSGGLLVLKCKNTLTLAGGHVDLRNAGFPNPISTVYRPDFTHERYGTLDTDTYSGSENSITREHLALNAGDGACLIIAKYIVSSSGSSRIGNPSTSGIQYCRAAADSKNAPANVSNLGGSSIFISCYSWYGFTPAQIAKYRSGTAGRGLARAYLAVAAPGNLFLPDEGLYALDCTQNKKRPKEQFNLSGFGNAQDGSYSLTSADAKKCFNSYAQVTAISGRVYTIRRDSADVDEMTDFQVGRLVMIHQIRKASATDYQDGNFKLSRITAISGSTVTIKHNFSFNLSTYYVQMVVIPEFNNLTVSKVCNTAKLYRQGCGGIFAVAVAGTCNLSGATINMEGRGTFNDVVNPMLGNFFMKRSLPLGQGNGSILIIAKNLTLSTSTRLGATYDGSKFGGRGGSGTKSNYPEGGGWSGHPGDSGSGTVINPGWGGGPGQGFGDYPETGGGWHSNAQLVSESAQSGKSATGCQGAHILIIADSITGLNLSALSTGGGSGYISSSAVYGQESGGCGYGGGGKIISSGHGTAGAGGYRGGGCGNDFAKKLNDGTVTYCGGGAAGACFIYANTISDQSTTGLVLF